MDNTKFNNELVDYLHHLFVMVNLNVAQFIVS